MDCNWNLALLLISYMTFRMVCQAYRLHQLTKAANFAEKLLLSLKELPPSPELIERTGGLFALMISFQLLGLVCLWSLMTFLLRLFPSRPVADHYWLSIAWILEECCIYLRNVFERLGYIIIWWTFSAAGSSLRKSCRLIFHFLYLRFSYQ